MLHYKPLPSPRELKTLYPLDAEAILFIENARKEISNILEGKDRRHLIIVGPCSIHDMKSIREYAFKLKLLMHEVADQFLLVMRTYFEKPRTVVGWKGFLHDPELNNSNNIEQGLKLTRQLLIDLARLKIPTAAEFLEPHSCAYLDDLIAWGCIGARTSASQTHRQMASGLPMPVAFKNSVEGNVEVAIHGVISSAQPHSYMGINQEGQISVMHTQGNFKGHVVLRGSDSSTNFDPASLAQVVKSLTKFNLPLNFLIDCSHGNSKRLHEQQCQVFHSVIDQIIEGNASIRGLMLESHLHAGNQPMLKNPQLLRYAVSLTDPCIDWETTAALIREAYNKMRYALPMENNFNQTLHSASCNF
jgi:3-deoxy-7-phosphoheptulonate synthase